ncbi:hypothetical protein Pla110_32320 [Polystyrenella longa]|uniref:HMA domain-containing protein n=1 Tax=Polystyrenella longa TaxID=2528007 RepID=A0A518CQK6_9PLAN|nr:MauE/DoxX family redox-associated membrane protein [Polystyrenella longa]QDU81490.1 hypothetical protein Pla110_32320 [Polystyrenella longa]
MTVQTYKTNLNCQKCINTVTPFLDSEPAIHSWSVNTNDPRKPLTITGEGVTSERVQTLVSEAGFKVLGPLPSDELSSSEQSHTDSAVSEMEDSRNWLETYFPLLLILAFLIGTVGLVEWRIGELSWSRVMGNFMGGFFLIFSFFKLLNLTGFATAYQTYDVIAKRSTGYAYAYPFIELGLGIAYLAAMFPIATNIVTAIVMLIGLAGVINALRKNQTIQCACLGTVFDLPMTIVTFFEDGIMAAMAIGMLIYHWPG